MEECGDDPVGAGSMDFPMHDWPLISDFLEDDDAVPYSGEGGGGVGLLDQTNAGLTQPLDFSSATHKEIIDFLRANYEAYREKNLHPAATNDNATTLTHQPEPWERNPPWFVMSKKFGSDDKTRQGYWKEKDNEFTAIRGDQWLQQRRPAYFGIYRVLEFYMNNGTKTEWRMSEFAMIHQSDDGLFFVKEEVVFSKVYKKDKDTQNCPSRDVANDDGHGEGEDNEPNRNNIVSHDDVHRHQQGVQISDQAPIGKRLRSDNDPAVRISESDVWQLFTKIYIQVPKEVGPSKRKDSTKQLVYAVCNHCDRVFRASSKKYGTSSLRRHAVGCQCKHLNQARARDNVLQPGPSGYAR